MKLKLIIPLVLLLTHLTQIYSQKQKQAKTIVSSVPVTEEIKYDPSLYSGITWR